MRRPWGGYSHQGCVEYRQEVASDNRIDNPGAYGKAHHMCDDPTPCSGTAVLCGHGGKKGRGAVVRSAIATGSARNQAGFAPIAA